MRANVRKMENVLTTVVVRVDPSMRDRQMYPDTNEYRVQFDQTYNGVVSVDLDYASLPATEPVVSTRNDTFVYRVGGGARKRVVLTHGTYTPTSLVTSLNSLLTAEGDGLLATYDAPTGKLTFSAGSSFVIYANDTTARGVLGLITSEPLVSSTASSPFELTCQGRVDVLGVKYVVIRSPDVLDRELGVVDLQKNPHQYVPCAPRPFKNYRRMSGIRLRIEREDGTLYDTGGVNHVLLLKLQYIDTKTPVVGTTTASQW